MSCTYLPDLGRFSECDGHGRHHRDCPDAPKVNPHHQPRLSLEKIDRLMHAAANAPAISKVGLEMLLADELRGGK